jgi:acetyl-CoA synthetase (ADP-forming)
VAVYGASDNRDKFGGRIMHFLLHHGFAGTIIPINPARAEIRGRTAYARLTDAPVKADVAILAVPSSRLEAAVSECAASGVGCCVIITTGLAEADEAGAALQDRLTRIALDAGMRLLGPNCMGLLNPGWHLALCSSVVLDIDRMLVGQIGLVSQSGALMVSLLDRAYADGIGFSCCVSLGNQADIEICDVLEYCIADPATHAICVYAEGFRDAPRFVRALAASREAGKPLVLLKTGRTEAGVRAAQSHTASLAGSYEALAAICRANGAVLVDDPVVMVRVADMLARGFRPGGDGIGVLSGSGGSVGIMADQLSAAGFRLARLSAQTKAQLGKTLLPPQADNPVDLGGRLPGDDDITAPTLAALAADPDVSLLILALSSMPFFAQRTRTMAEAALASGKPAAALVLPGPAADRPRAVLRELGIPCFGSSADLRAALRGVLAYQAPLPEAPSARPVAMPAVAPAGDAEALVRAYGIPVPAQATCTTAGAAAEAASRIGYPVVLKGAFSTIVHKSDLGLVKTGIADPHALRAAWDAITQSVAAHGLGAAFLGCLVQQQIAPGLELILSARHDPQFGPFVLVGAGGVLVELVRDIEMAPAPVTRATALAMLRRLRVAALFDSYRGGPAYDIGAAADAVVRLGWLAADLGPRLADLECNPLVVGVAGACAVDIRATFDEAGEPTS